MGRRWGLASLRRIQSSPRPHGEALGVDKRGLDHLPSTVGATKQLSLTIKVVEQGVVRGSGGVSRWSQTRVYLCWEPQGRRDTVFITLSTRRPCLLVQPPHRSLSPTSGSPLNKLLVPIPFQVTKRVPQTSTSFHVPRLENKACTMASSEEKVGFENIEAANPDHKSAPISPDNFGFSPAEQKRIIRHVDRRLVVTVGFMYCISVMDRTNLGAANIAGLAKDLSLTGSRYVSFTRLLPPWYRKRFNVSEYHFARLFLYVHRLSTAIDHHRAQDWTSPSPGCDYCPLGRVYAWNGLRKGLGAAYCDESCARCL